MQALVPASSQVVTHFSRHQTLTVRQRKRWMEILLSFEMKNAYDVFDEENMPVLRVEEQGQGFVSFLKRVFLGTFRPFLVHAIDLANQGVLLRIERPFRFIFHRIAVTGPEGEHIGAIERRWSWLRRIYSVQDQTGSEVATLFGPILRPWTFEIRSAGQGEVLGLIQKKWSGIGKEMFTDADNFRLDLAGVSDPTLKALLFSATVLIDVCHFERQKG